MKPEVKKLILSNLPYLIFVYLFGKLGQAYRLAAGVDLSEKLLHFMDGCSAAFANAAPSFHPFDLLIGVAGAAALRLMVYCKSKNAKKYRKGEEYGSARWRASPRAPPRWKLAPTRAASGSTVPRRRWCPLPPTRKPAKCWTRFLLRLDVYSGSVQRGTGCPAGSPYLWRE